MDGASSSSAATSAILFEDIFDVERLNPEGKKFDRVDRLVAKGETYETDLKLDIANEVFSLKAGDKFTFALASTLRLDGKPDSDYYDPDGKPSLLDQYEYGMCGKVFKYEHMGERQVCVAMDTRATAFGHLLACMARRAS